ncbi:MAG: ammonium transporter, partial [Thermoplasmatota archaeon]
GFNAGSALAANGVAANALVTTMLGGSLGMLSWMAANWWFDGKPTATGAVTGAVAGLATITPASGFVAPWAAALIGLAAGAVCFGATKFRARRGWDDALDVWGCHGVGGTLGVIATGLFASAAVNPSIGSNVGVVEGRWHLFGVQVMAALFVAVYAFVVTFLILRVMRAFRPIQATAQEELSSRDLMEHGEAAYQL